MADFYPLTRAQYYDLRSRAKHLNSETRLLFAVLVDAIQCAALYRQSSSIPKPRELRDAVEWINTSGDHDLFSFDSICRVLEIEPEGLRRRLNRMSASHSIPRRLHGVGRTTTITITR
jgi:hypothetical protein